MPSEQFMHKNENIKVIEKELGTRLLVLKGGVWTLFGFGSNQVLRLLSNLLLTHLLAPDIFGLMALVSIFITGLQMFSDLGIGQCIIQNPRGDEPQFLNTAFSMQIIRGVFLWLASCALAYPFSLIYNQSGLFYLIPIASLSTVIAGFANTAIWSLTRHVQLGKVIILNTLSNFVGVGVSIIWALVHPTVWVIVGGNLAMVTCECIGSHFLLQSRNWPQWDLNARKSILGFGKGIFLSSATWFLAGQAERLILGRFVSLAWLGVFSIALLLAESVSNAFQEVISRAIFPTIAKSLRENRVQALRQHEKMRWAVLLTTITLAILIIAAAKPIVGLVFNAKYQEASWMIQILILRTVIGMI